VLPKPSIGAQLRRRLLAPVTVLLGVLCVFSQLSSVVHWALVEHVRCAEHGDWVHADEEHAGADLATPAARQVSLVASEALDEHAHDHCEFLSERHELTLAPAAFGLLQAPAALASSPGASAAEASGSGALYALAPKTSPPA
jgi:hypothetical protein